MVLICRALQQLKRRASNVAIGRAYELLSIEVLRSQSFQLTHRGRPGDKGIDFWGTWVLPSLEIAVAGQCKCLKTPVGSTHVREFEGTVEALRRSSRGQWLGVFVSRKGFSISAIQAFRLSPLPLLAVHLVPNATAEEGGSSSAEEQTPDKESCVSSEDSTEEARRTELEPDGSCEELSSKPGRRGEWKPLQANLLFERATEKDQLGQMSLTAQQDCVDTGPSLEGRIASLLMNDMAQRELPSLSIATRQLPHDDVSQSGGPSDGVVLLYHTAMDGVTWDLGDVRQRMPPSGKPLQWGVWTE